MSTCTRLEIGVSIISAKDRTKCHAHKTLLRTLVALKGADQFKIVEGNISRRILASPILQGIDTGVFHEWEMTHCGGEKLELG